MRYSSLALRSRRFISLATASRIKSERFSPSFNTASICASVPAGNRAGICSSLIFGRPTLGRISDIAISVNAAPFMISPIYTYMISCINAIRYQIGTHDMATYEVRKSYRPEYWNIVRIEDGQIVEQFDSKDYALSRCEKLNRMVAL